jgi:hypothetical protein
MLAECARRDLGKVEKVERAYVEDRINGTRRMLAKMEFDEAGCSVGVKCLKNYRKDWDEDLGVWKDKPRHDWASHGADSLGGLALFYQGLKPEPSEPAKPKWWHEQTAGEVFALDKLDTPKRDWV